MPVVAESVVGARRGGDKSEDMERGPDTDELVNVLVGDAERARYGLGERGPEGAEAFLECDLSSKNAIRSPARLPGGGATSEDDRECLEGEAGVARIAAENACEVGRVFSVRSVIVLRRTRSAADMLEKGPRPVEAYEVVGV